MSVALITSILLNWITKFYRLLFVAYRILVSFIFRYWYLDWFSIKMFLCLAKSVKFIFPFWDSVLVKETSCQAVQLYYYIQSRLNKSFLCLRCICHNLFRTITSTDSFLHFVHLWCSQRFNGTVLKNVWRYYRSLEEIKAPILKNVEEW